jgi:hypothetical protein
VEPEAPIGVVVDEYQERSGGGRNEPRFLAQFTKRRFDGFFAFFDLAAGKLPRASQVLIVGATSNEDQASSHDDRQGDVEAVGGVGDQAGAPAAPGL